MGIHELYESHHSFGKWFGKFHFLWGSIYFLFMLTLICWTLFFIAFSSFHVDSANLMHEYCKSMSKGIILYSYYCLHFSGYFCSLQYISWFLRKNVLCFIFLLEKFSNLDLKKAYDSVTIGNILCKIYR